MSQKFEGIIGSKNTDNHGIHAAQFADVSSNNICWSAVGICETREIGHGEREKETRT